MRLTAEIREMTVGVATLAVVVLFFMFLYVGREVARSAAGVDYVVIAKFGRVDGLFPGDAVRLAGVRIGTVTRQRLDADFRAVVSMRIDSAVRLPTDTSAAIHTDGLFGSKYVVLDPGGEEEELEDGDAITFTQGALVVADLLELIIAEGRAARQRAKEATAE